MTPRERARRTDALRLGNLTRIQLCERIALLESALIDMQSDINAQSRDVGTLSLRWERELRLLGLRRDA